MGIWLTVSSVISQPRLRNFPSSTKIRPKVSFHIKTQLPHLGGSWRPQLCAGTCFWGKGAPRQLPGSAWIKSWCKCAGGSACQCQLKVLCTTYRRVYLAEGQVRHHFSSLTSLMFSQIHVLTRCLATLFAPMNKSI